MKEYNGVRGIKISEGVGDEMLARLSAGPLGEKTRKEGVVGTSKGGCGLILIGSGTLRGLDEDESRESGPGGQMRQIKGYLQMELT